MRQCGRRGRGGWKIGCRAGGALGLRHKDIAAAKREISIVPHEDAKAKGRIRRQTEFFR